MFTSHVTKHLREGEVVVRIVRRAPIVEAGRALLAVVLVLGAFFFIFPLFHWGPWGVVSFLVLLAAGLVLGLRSLFVWSVNVFVLTNERIVDIDQQGFFTTVVSSARYDKVQDVSFSIRGVWQTLFRIGTVEVQTAGSDLRLELSGVQNPQQVQELIAEQAQRQGGGGRQAAEQLLQTLERVETALPAEAGRLNVTPRSLDGLAGGSKPPTKGR